MSEAINAKTRRNPSQTLRQGTLQPEVERSGASKNAKGILVAAWNAAIRKPEGRVR